MTLTSVGIIAWNESAGIARTIRSIASQDVLRKPDHRFEVICIANGCTDNTVDVASAVMEECFGPSGSVSQGAGHALAWRVEELSLASKTNAWNHFVHRASGSRAEFLVFMDGDVRLMHSAVLGNLLEPLGKEGELWISGGTPCKTFEQSGLSLLLKPLSKAVSSVRHADDRGFGGCLYACRSSIARRFWLPAVLVGEDSFVRAIVQTEFFTTNGQTERVRRAKGSEVAFEAYLSPKLLFKSWRRRAVGGRINEYLYKHLWEQVPSAGRDAGQLVSEWERLEGPDWSRVLVADAIARDRPALLPRGYWSKWFSRVRRVGGIKGVVLLPIACLLPLIALAPTVAAGLRLRSGSLEGLWFKTNE